MSRYRFLCEGCVTLYKHETSYPHCKRCRGDYNQIKKLQLRIVRERPHLGRLSPAELFEKLYETLKKERKECR